MNHPPSLETNKRIALDLSRAIALGDWVAADHLLADDFTYVVDGRPPIDKAAYLGFMRGVLAAGMTDMAMTFPRVVAEDDLVAVEYTNTMTHSGPFFGIPATGRRVTTTGHLIRRVRDGRITAEWQTTTSAGLMQALTAST